MSQAEQLVAMSYPADYEPAPSVQQLTEQGMAKPINDLGKKFKYYRVTPEGYEHLGAVMRRNAQRMRALDKEQTA